MTEQQAGGPVGPRLGPAGVGTAHGSRQPPRPELKLPLAQPQPRFPERAPGGPSVDRGNAALPDGGESSDRMGASPADAASREDFGMREVAGREGESAGDDVDTAVDGLTQGDSLAPLDVVATKSPRGVLPSGL